MKLFPAKISERVTLQKSMTSEGNSALLPANVDRRLMLQRGYLWISCFKISSYVTNHFKAGPSEND